MLKGGAFEFYLTDLARTPTTFDEIVLAIYERFESTSTKNLKRFRSLTLRKVMDENRGKLMHECFELLCRELETIYKSFNLTSSNDTLLISQLKSAVQDMGPICRPALRWNESTYRELINAIRKCLRPSIDLYMYSKRQWDSEAEADSRSEESYL
ncbi:hypothetical protein E4U14_007464 [Claviceps sp. LM454 group G7]|nr:hypothetical protein E4U14_007464 [Claviceps sp. LM454 group G7]